MTVRRQVYDLLMTIKNDTHEISIPKSKIYSCIPYSELETVAEIILSDSLDVEQLYWAYIEDNATSIQLNLRPIFLSLDITIVRDESLKRIVEFMHDFLSKSSTPIFPDFVKQWLPENILPYMINSDGTINPKRFEFFFYKKLAHHISTKKLILEHSIRHKAVEDNLIKLPKWKKDKSNLLRTIPYSKIKGKPISLMNKLEQDLPELYQKINHNIQNGNNTDVLIKTSKAGEPTWRLKPLDKASDPNESLFINFQKRSIVDVMQFVNSKTHYSDAFESILPRYAKQSNNELLINAVILANALRIGVNGMSDICDLKLSSLITAEKSFVRMETLNDALHKINIELSKLEIFKDYDIHGNAHASLDGLKIGSRLANIAARHSPKFLGQDAGVSSYNLIFNYLSIIGKLISSNQYEGNFTFEMMLHQNMSDFNIEYASTDKHGMNCLNFALFDLTDYIFAPRIPKPHNQTLWGFGKHHQYKDLLIKPHKMVNKNYVLNNWDHMQRMLVSMITGESIPSIVIAQMSSQNYRSPTKLAFSHYNHIIRSKFILNYIDDKNFRRGIECALNRGEAYNNLYRAITVLNGGKFRGQSEAEMIIWDQCTKLIAAVILYYNTYILNHLYLNANTPQEKEWLLNLSPGAWVHINLLGYYQFYGADNAQFIEDILSKWNWKETMENG